MKPFFLLIEIIFSKSCGKEFLSHLLIISSGLPLIINLNSFVKKLYTIEAELKLPLLMNFLYILNLNELIFELAISN